MSAQEKQNLRVQIHAQRTKRPQIELVKAGEDFVKKDWNALITGENVACYASWGAEPTTSALRTKLTELGKQVYLPIIKSDTEMLWGLDRAPYTENRFGIREPEVSPFELSSASAIILPALCADESGIRLGRGAGYFDRALASIASHQSGGPIRIALLFDDEIFPSVPSNEHDARVDLIVTPKRVINCKNNLS